ncbi:GSCFA domain-containing protein [Salipiger sp. IMCC34102]|uniref:GSCFA domain-containing protein n=1 Tax=Salipiger sp. IMCC34102 TaxID=2510647 RepID=UPI0013EA8EA0|nr:GSCFA domain-containing protein [Salipiger sp. IMCC34102]
MTVEVFTPDAVRARLAANRSSEVQTGSGRFGYVQPRIATDSRIAPDATFFVVGDGFARALEDALRAVDRYVLSAPRDADTTGRPGIGNLDVASNALGWAFAAEDGQDDALIEVDGRWIDMQARPDVSHELEEARSLRRRRTAEFERIAQADVILAVTTGVEQWFDRHTGLYLGAKPSPRMTELYPDRFELHRLDLAAVEAQLTRFCALVKTHGKPGALVLLAVSPVADSGSEDPVADTFLGQAIQRIACARIVRDRDGVEYLPALESAILSDARFGYLDTDPGQTSPDLAARVMADLLEAYADPDPAQALLHARGHGAARLLAGNPGAALEATTPAMAANGWPDDEIGLIHARALAGVDRQAEAIDLLLDRLEGGRATDPDRIYATTLDLVESHGTLAQIDRLLAVSGQDGRPDDEPAPDLSQVTPEVAPAFDERQTEEGADHVTLPDGPAPAPAFPDLPRDVRVQIEAAASALKAQDNLGVIKRSISLLEAEDALSFDDQERVFSYLVQAMMREGQHAHLLPVLLDRIERLPDPGPRWPALVVKLARTRGDLPVLREIQRLRGKFPADVDLSEIDARAAALSEAETGATA